VSLAWWSTGPIPSPRPVGHQGGQKSPRGRLRLHGLNRALVGGLISSHLPLGNVFAGAGIHPQRVGGRRHPAARSLAAGAAVLALPWAMAIGLLIVPGESSSARAQTLQETWNFIAKPDSWVKMRDFSDDFSLANSQISNCVVTGADHSWPNAVLRFRIDFNKLLANTLKETDAPSATVKIYMEGDEGAIQVMTHYYQVSTNSAHDHTDSSHALGIGFGSTEIERKLNAFNYFIRTFCPGKHSAF
jgi:hypothetical protein